MNLLQILMILNLKTLLMKVVMLKKKVLAMNLYVTIIATIPREARIAVSERHSSAEI